MRKGFTLLELLIVVVILGILALIAAPTLLNAADTAKNGAVSANVSAAASSITSQFALNTSQTATASVAAILPTLAANQDPVNSALPAYVQGTAGAAGQVALSPVDASDQVIITAYGYNGAVLMTKTVQAPQ